LAFVPPMSRVTVTGWFEDDALPMRLSSARTDVRVEG